jgi:hypothetical protein
MEHMESLKSAIWMVITGIVTGLLSKFLVEVLWWKYMKNIKTLANRIKVIICNERDRIYAIIQAMKRVHLPSPDWDEDYTKNSTSC